MVFQDSPRLIPPSPVLKEKILKTKQHLSEGRELPQKETIDILDLQTLTFITSRRRRTHNARSIIAPVTGTRRALVLLVDFSDNQAKQTQQYYKDMLFSSGTYSTGSMQDFFKEASYGKLILTGEISGQGSTKGWYRAPNPYTYYTNNNYGVDTYPRNTQKLVEDIVDLAAPYVNFKDYDNDGDGVVDALFIIHAGPGAEATGNKNHIWSHQWEINPKTVDGVIVRTYSIEPEDGRIGVFCHELMHVFGMPDLYDTDYSSEGTGSWDLMAAGSWNGKLGDTPAHPTAYCKNKLGWVTPIVIFNAKQTITLKPYATNDGQIYKLPIGTTDSKEYFLLSNRKKIGFDSQLPGEGLIIEHVDETKTNNTDETHYLVDIEQADGKQDLNKNANRGDANDPFPYGNNKSFLVDTVPSSKAYSGADSKIKITSIQRAGDNITADVEVDFRDVDEKIWIYNKKVLATFVNYTSQWAWVNIETVGWRRIKDGSADGVTNIFTACCNANANGRQIHAYIDNTYLYTIYLL
ncbi:M6 family metalloprotease domain-containing protein [Scytonema sp. UIC 10036]|uniref:M6 family metalloprotease domain-containing protein n=1 Tax=Scytonema sp. UIC 10036 TaxID=2304196 RepID=UPI0012DA504B|nr:M6 family metalloprotease domain-containing protein [Scytonema sp. UIC 10036]MUG93603.1 M6 family metalloprotease domain-containing protein [Scytonema sp. UIC 10036]